MKEKLYRFKNVKHSVVMRIIKYTDQFPDGDIWLENKDYKGLLYKAKFDEIEEIEDDRS